MRKNYGQQFIEFLLFSNFWVALSAGFLSAGFNKHLGISQPSLVGIFTFCCTYLAYNFHRLIKIYQLKTISSKYTRLYWQQNNLKFTYLSGFICMLTSCVIYYTVWGFTLDHIGLIGTIIGVTLFYVLPIPGLNKTLRSIPMNKIVWITMAWVLLLAFPSVMDDENISIQPLLICAIWVFAQSIPFDIRDLSYDPKHLKTIPQLIGATGSRMIATTFVLIPLFIDNTLVYSIFYQFALILSLIGCWASITSRTLLYLELVWEGALLILGIHFWFS